MQLRMWRFINSITRGVRSVRPSHCCSQEYVDDNKYLCVPPSQHSLTLHHYSILSPWHCTASLNNRISHVTVGKTLTSIFLENKSRAISHPLAKVSTGAPETQKKWSGGSIRDRCTVNLNSRPPWCWEILLDLSPLEDSQSKEKKEKREDKQNWHRACRRKQRERFLLTHSILQAVGWGSAVALTWSLYRDWDAYRCRYHRCKERQYGHLHHGNRDQENSNRCRNRGNKYQYSKEDNQWHCSSHYFSGFPEYHKGQYYEHTKLHRRIFCSHPFQDVHPNLQYIFSSEASKSLFSSLWSLAANQHAVCQPELKKAIQEKVSSLPIDSSAKVLDTLDTHSDIQESQDEISKELKQSFENEIESLTLAEADLCEQGECSLQSEKANLDCSQSSKLCSNLYSLSVEQEHSKNSSGEQNFIPGRNNTKEDKSAKDTKVQKNAERQEELIIITSNLVKTQHSSSREEVKIEDCTSDDSGQSTASSSSSQNFNKSGIQEFSDSLMQILSAESQDIKNIQDKLVGVLEGDIGLSLVDTDPDSAVIYFQAGALLGDPSAIFNLALCYHLGRGVTQDFKMARELYEAASLAGHGWATYNLAVLVSQGQGGPADLDRAYNLLFQASKRGVHEAQEALHEMEKQRENDLLKADSLRPSRSDPALTSVSSRKWSSSYSTSDLDFFEESNLVLADLSTDLDNTKHSQSMFYLG